jgi:hypothetical protein
MRNIRLLASLSVVLMVGAFAIMRPLNYDVPSAMTPVEQRFQPGRWPAKSYALNIHAGVWRRQDNCSAWSWVESKSGTTKILPIRCIVLWHT